MELAEGGSAVQNRDAAALSKNNLNNIIQYCEDVFECRRVLQLQHFGEVFDRENCRESCDNCSNKMEGASCDMTEDAIRILNLGKV